ncbi:hypothetical protein CEP54_012373 [Fusarium duplospermum]|uniref:Rho-GAP domain-containing protein n=1 Tax=Fusarium duplospermum TaxID=1325734 RepID=A0A428P961_9HYPO|nr:hypothetical protein CEP54_012373 [Fusarium duplospermum]
MSDPLSTAASVVGLLTAAAQISKILANVIDKARHAPEECSRIKGEVDDIRNVLVTLQLYIIGTQRAARSRTSLIMVEQVVATLAACVKTFSELDTFAAALQNDSDMQILDRLRWASKDKEIKAVLVRLESHKSSLTLMLTILTCQSQDDAESRVDKLCDLVEQMLLRDLTLKERLVALEARNGLEEPGETIDTRLHELNVNDTHHQGQTPDPISVSNKQPEWQRNSYGFAFEETLMSSRAYRIAARDNSDGFSIISSAGRTASWSMLSGLSLSEVSHIGIQAIPIYASDITNKEHYDFSPSAPNFIQAEDSEQSSLGKMSRRTSIENIFATMGSPVRIRKLQQAFESPPTYGRGLDWTPYTLHDAAGIFLRYLKSLPEPIIPYDCYGGFMEGLTPYIDRELTEEESAEALEVATRLIDMMPSLNRDLLAYVLDILSVFASRARFTKMTDLRLISVFQPSIISGPPDEMDAEAHHVTTGVAMMLLKHETDKIPQSEWVPFD